LRLLLRKVWSEKIATGNMKFKTRFIFFLLFWIPCISYSQEFQDLEKYEIQGAKLGKKIARQVIQSNYERTVTTNKVESWHGYGYGDNKGNHRLTSFVGAMDGAVVGSLAYNYTYQNYYHGKRSFNYRKPNQYSSDISALNIANITYADDDEDGILGKDESAQIYFDLINTGDEPLYGITPVLMPNKTKHIQISTPCVIDTLQGKHALRYVIEMQGDGKTNPGKLQLVLRIKYGQAKYADVAVIGLGTKKRKE